MAQNWAVTPRKTRALRVIDLLTTPLAALDRLRRRRSSPADAPRRILVVECWQLGDAIMAVPFLRALRARFPHAHVALLCKASTRTLLEPSALVDEYVVADLPWTAFSGKYALSRYTDGSVRALVRRLRGARFDVTIDARADVRANVLTWLTRAPMRIGFGGAGARLLTHPVPGPRDTHKVEDWLAMLSPLGGAVPTTEPRIALDPEAVASVERWLRTHRIAPATRLVAIHPSARLDVRRWPIERFAALARALQSRSDVQVVAFVDPDGYGHELAAIDGVVTVQPTLAELPAYLASCDLFVGNDSGPAHIAGAVGTPTVTIFGPQVAAWYRPFGAEHRVVQLDDVPCRPCFDQCDRVEHVCLTGIDAARVLTVVDERLDAIAASRSPRRANETSGTPAAHYLSRL